MLEALAQLEALRKRLSVRIEGTLRLGVIEAMQPVLLPGLLKLLRERYPGLALQLERGKSAPLTAAQASVTSKSVH